MHLFKLDFKNAVQFLHRALSSPPAGHLPSVEYPRAEPYHCRAVDSMARLEYISYTFFTAALTDANEPIWIKDGRSQLEQLPQIFWDDGSGWPEANVWALERAAGGKVELLMTWFGHERT
jgi:hypothetical protein